jgi:glycosyltransferase involved in cell wall biosynthesis
MISVVIPVFNERDTISVLLDKVRATPFEKEIIVVDDGSTDGTRDVLAQEAAKGVRVVLHEVNRGKGAALRTGFSQVRGDVVIVQDADLEYNPAEYGRLLEPILDGRADVVYGSRFLGGPHRVLYFWHYVGNRLLTLLSNMTTNLNLTDMETCYKVFKTEILERIELKSDRFGFEVEFTAKVAKLHCRIYETNISYDGRSYLEGKKIGWRDGLAALGHIIRYRFWD